MINEDSGDAEILQSTTRDAETGAFKIVLEDGHVLQGGPLEGTPDFKVVSSWCEGVRNAIAARNENVRAEAVAAKRRRQEEMIEVASQTFPDEEEEQEEEEDEVLDPFEYAELQVDKWSVILHNLRDKAIELQAQLEEADRSHKQWKRIYESLSEYTNDEK